MRSRPRWHRRMVRPRRSWGRQPGPVGTDPDQTGLQRWRDTSSRQGGLRRINPSRLRGWAVRPSGSRTGAPPAARHGAPQKDRDLDARGEAGVERDHDGRRPGRYSHRRSAQPVAHHILDRGAMALIDAGAGTCRNRSFGASRSSGQQVESRQELKRSFEERRLESCQLCRSRHSGSASSRSDGRAGQGWTDAG
jgi:hypothetical protein